MVCWFDVAGALQMKLKSELKIRSVKSAKFDSRVDGSSIFEVPRGSKIDEKSMQKRLRDKTSS